MGKEENTIDTSLLNIAFPSSQEIEEAIYLKSFTGMVRPNDRFYLYPDMYMTRYCNAYVGYYRPTFGGIK